MHAELVAGKMFHEQCGHLGRGPGDGRTKQALATKLKETRDHDIPTNRRRPLIFHSLHNYRRRKVGIVQHALTKQPTNRPWCRSSYKSRRGRAARLSELALAVPPAQAIDIRSPELRIHRGHRNRIRSCDDFVLSCQDHIDRTNGRREAKLFPLAKSWTKIKVAIDVDAWARHRFIERCLCGPVRERAIGVSRFVKAYPN